MIHFKEWSHGGKMKVTNNATNGMQNIESAKSANKKAEKSGIESKNREISKADLASSSKVDLSSRAQNIQKAKEVIRATPDIDEAKVAHFQNLIDSGKYKTDAKSIADKIVDDHLMFGTNED
jgi:negative regulator of flagellin synthesis FlgM